MKLLGIPISAVIIFLLTPALAGSMSCPPPWTDGWVKDIETAKAIYLAVGRAQHIPYFAKYPDIVVEDAGDHWAVSQTDNRPLPAPKPGTVIVSLGGGQLRMNIDKCKGTISEAWLNK